MAFRPAGTMLLVSRMRLRPDLCHLADGRHAFGKWHEETPRTSTARLDDPRVPAAIAVSGVTFGPTARSSPARIVRS